MAKARCAAEKVKRFPSLVEKHEIANFQTQVLNLLIGPISNAAVKLNALNSPEAMEIIESTGYGIDFKNDVQTQLMEQFEEEVFKAQDILKCAAAGILKLEECVEDINVSLSMERNLGQLQSGLLTDCYEHCRKILVYFKLRNKLLKHHLLAPPQKLLQVNPFPPQLQDEEDHIIYLLAKIQHAPLLDSS